MLLSIDRTLLVPITARVMTATQGTTVKRRLMSVHLIHVLMVEPAM